VESPRAKAEQKSASPSAAIETKQTKGRTQSSPEQVVKQPESAREKAQERQQTQMEKGKSEAAVEIPRAKVEEKSTSSGVATAAKETKGRKSPASVAETKPESTVEPRDRKATRAEEKAATPIKSPEVIERKGARQVGTDQKEKSLAGPAKAPEAKTETKGGNQTAAAKMESREEKNATKDAPEGKGKSDETKEEKIARKQKTLD